MASSPADAAVDISKLHGYLIYNRVIAATIAFFSYEWLVTFDQEVNRIWARKWTVTTWVFAANRYLTMLYTIIRMIPTPNYASCVWQTRLEDALVLLQFLVIALFTALRAYALCDRTKWVFLLVFCLSIVPFFTNTVIFVLETTTFSVAFPTNICEAPFPFSETINLRSSLATRIAVITADLIVLLLTWRKAFGMIRHASRFKLQVPLLFRILVRDGTFFFLGLLAANVFKFVTTNISSLVTLEAGDTFLTPLTSMIISRFILNLQEINEKDDLSGTTLQSSIRFNSNGIVGSLGDRIMFGDDVDEGDQITTRGYDESRVDHL